MKCRSDQAGRSHSRSAVTTGTSEAMRTADGCRPPTDKQRQRGGRQRQCHEIRRRRQPPQRDDGQDNPDWQHDAPRGSRVRAAAEPLGQARSQSRDQPSAERSRRRQQREEARRVGVPGVIHLAHGAKHPRRPDHEHRHDEGASDRGDRGGHKPPETGSAPNGEQQSHPGSEPGDQRQPSQEARQPGSRCDDADPADVEVERPILGSLVQILLLESPDGGDDPLACLANRVIRQAVGRVEMRVVGVAVADVREVQARSAVPLEDGEVGVVREALVDLGRVRRAERPRRRAGPCPHQPRVAGSGLEEGAGTGGADRLEVQVRLDVPPDRVVDQRGAPIRPASSASVSATTRLCRRSRSPPPARGQPRGTTATPSPASAGPWAGRDRIVVGDQRHGVSLAARLDRDDVEDVHRSPDLRAHGVGVLHVHIEARALKLANDVLARAAVGFGADGTNADGPAQHVDVGARVGNGEAAGRGRGARGQKADRDSRRPHRPPRFAPGCRSWGLPNQAEGGQW